MSFGRLQWLAALLLLPSLAACGSYGTGILDTFRADRRGLTCAFVPRGDSEMTKVERCADLDAGGNIHLARPLLGRLTFDTDGLARVHVGSWFVVNKDGRSAPIATFDNGPDDFVDGFARSPRGSQMGFIDRNLRRFGLADGALRFRGGVAAVCDGCTLRSDGEHSWYEGGKWRCLTGEDKAIFPYRSLKPGETPDTLCDPYRK